MIIKSNFLKPGSNKKMLLLQNYYLEIDKLGKINYFGDNPQLINGFPNREINDMTDSIILPGLIDLHTHIPQYPAVGLGKGTLLNWLENYIFPLEAKFANSKYSFDQSLLFFKDCIKFGTTTVVAYSSSSYEGTNSAFRAAESVGIRAFIGLSMMDFNAPSELLNDTNANIDFAKKLIKQWHQTNSGMLNYIMTPRYALVCTENLMSTIGEIANNEHLFIQTHLAENKDELRNVISNFPSYNTYTDVYDKTGLLTERTILAHCLYLSDYEIDLISNKSANIAHCPSSNRYLKSGIFDYGNISKMIKTGIGTDVAAGTSLSMLSEIKEAIETTKTYSIFFESDSETLSASEAIWVSTKGNAEILALSKETGDFEQGLFADFVAFKLDRLMLDSEILNTENVTSKLIYLLGNNYANNVFIKGKQLFELENQQLTLTVC